MRPVQGRGDEQRGGQIMAALARAGQLAVAGFVSTERRGGVVGGSGRASARVVAPVMARLDPSPNNDTQEAVAARTPLGRVGQPEEVAAAVAFFASDDSSYVSGQTLYINGGAR